MGRTNISAIVLDVDGVLTDGRLYVAESGESLKVFYVQDGSAIKRWLGAGNEMIWLTGRSSPIIGQRASELGVKHVYEGVEDKGPVLEEILSEHHIAPGSTCYVGDDMPDTAAMELCGYAVAVANAVPAVKAIADYTTTVPGGLGAVREVIDLLMSEGAR